MDMPKPITLDAAEAANPKLLRWAAEALMGFDLGLYHAPKLLAYL